MKKPIIFRLSSVFRFSVFRSPFLPFSSSPFLLFSLSPFLLFALSPFLLYSCKTTKHIETVKTEYKTNHIRDSIHCYDSVYIKDKGDTIFLERYKYLYQDRIVRDSIFINDTIRIPVPSGLRSSASGLRPPVLRLAKLPNMVRTNSTHRSTANGHLCTAEKDKKININLL